MTIFVGLDEAAITEAILAVNLGEDSDIVFRDGVHQATKPLFINNGPTLLWAQKRATIIIKNCRNRPLLELGPDAKNIKLENLTLIEE